MARVTLYIALLCTLALASGCAQLGVYRLSLRVSPPDVPSPLTVFLAAEITGGLDTSPELYCQSQWWDFGDGHRVGVFGLCPAWKPGTRIDRKFGMDHAYEKPGVYRARVSYGSLESEPVLVRVPE